MSQEYTEDQQAAIAAVNATLTAVNLPTYTSLEDKLYQALTACTESIQMGKRLYQELTMKKDAEKQVAITAENFPEFKKLYLKAVRSGAEQFEFEGRETLTSYAKYVVEYVEGSK